ncbi:MAG: hypothetical protein IPJ74_18890 [Saprospiraceae bacterium]|nr:hypothetical protein [Saprospiraceae bacterium]
MQWWVFFWWTTHRLSWHPTCTSVAMALQHSCNAYFVTVFREVVDTEGFYNPQKGLDVFNSYLDRMGLGRTLGVDFPNEKKGNYPTSKYYNDMFESGRQARNGILPGFAQSVLAKARCCSLQCRWQTSAL